MSLGVPLLRYDLMDVEKRKRDVSVTVDAHVFVRSAFTLKSTQWHYLSDAQHLR